MTARHYWFGMMALVSIFLLSSALVGPLYDAVQKGDID